MMEVKTIWLEEMLEMRGIPPSSVKKILVHEKVGNGVEQRPVRLDKIEIHVYVDGTTATLEFPPTEKAPAVAEAIPVTS